MPDIHGNLKYFLIVCYLQNNVFIWGIFSLEILLELSKQLLFETRSLSGCNWEKRHWDFIKISLTFLGVLYNLLVNSSTKYLLENPYVGHTSEPDQNTIQFHT